MCQSICSPQSPSAPNTSRDKTKQGEKMNTTKWILISLIAISYVAYLVWENKREKSKDKAPLVVEEVRDVNPINNASTLASLPLNFGKQVEIGLEDLVHAQNRTTHAVRAFVRFLFIQLSGITLATIFWEASNLSIDQERCASSGEKCSGNTFLQVVSVVTAIISVILSSRAGWSELSKSDIPIEQEESFESESRLR
jgi:hypothetical protein